MTFKELYLSGQVPFEEIDRYISRWNRSDDERTLAKYLGLNADEEDVWIDDSDEALKEMLRSTLRVLRPGGRLVVITYHSLEDRLVKNFLKTGNFEGKCEQDFFGNVRSPFRLVNNKVIVPTDEEVERNPRSRSAKLRIAEKV